MSLSQRVEIPDRHPALGYECDSVEFLENDKAAFTLRGTKATDPMTRHTRMLKALWKDATSRHIMRRHGLRPGGD